MPREVEDKLRKQGREKGYRGERLDRYVYGTMQKKGLLKKHKKD